MKPLISIIILLVGLSALANEPDSAYFFAFSTQKNHNHNGLHYAWSIDKKNWHTIGNDFAFLKCDYGAWGSQKRMIEPLLICDKDNIWHCIWSVNETDNVIAHAESKNLIDWKPQLYTTLIKDKNIVEFNNFQILKNTIDNKYTIAWSSAKNGNAVYFKTETIDFKHYGLANEISKADFEKIENQTNRCKGTIDSKYENGSCHFVAWTTIKNIIAAFEQNQYRSNLANEQAEDDNTRFANLKPINIKVKLDTKASKQISDKLLGIFFEDINYAADGGLYAELIQNRSFEYDQSDCNGRNPQWTHTYAWTLHDATMSIDTIMPINSVNRHYAVVETKSHDAIVLNSGYNGIPFKAKERYTFTLFAKQITGKADKLTVRLIGDNNEVIAQTKISIGKNWRQHKAELTAQKDASNGRLEISTNDTGKYALDMVSLFPVNTFKHRVNGLRNDLAQTIADLHPKFVRFPGGCVAHGNGLNNIYNWKNTIGPVESRITQSNLWGYHQSVGLGYFEYFQFCEDIGATPVPVIAAGVPCQNSSVGGCGQQGGIPMDKMDAYIQDILDLIEYANGDEKSHWGAKRAKAGHVKPFNLKYIGIGNEDLITDVFEERFTKIFNAIKQKYPEIEVIGTAGPFFEGSDYVAGWEIATKLNVPLIDEHYYNSPGWFINNQDFYDRYDRKKSKVYLGEYAAHLPGRPNNIETALAEALYLTSVERNGDVVSMTSYAPLLAKEGHTQWNPDLIYFNNNEVKPTVGYYVQKMYGQNSGTEYIPSTVELDNNSEKVTKRIGISVVCAIANNDIIIKMVNMLPVEVNANVDLSNIETRPTKATKTVLSGAPADCKTQPTIGSIDISDKLDYTLPAYSFTVFRFTNGK